MFEGMNLMFRIGKSRESFGGRIGGFALIATFICLSAAAGAATDINVVAGASGAWDISLNDTNRKCRLYLRPESDAVGHALGMPAGCRRALPILVEVTAWNMPDDGRIDLADKHGAAVLSFAPANETALAARGPEGETYELVNLNPTFRTGSAQSQNPQGLNAQGLNQQGLNQQGLHAQAPAAQIQIAQTRPRGPAPAATSRAAQQQAGSGPPARPSEIPGRYAVLRENGRDTGCMITLMDQSRGRGVNRAQLAPACRDQGIVIFDPIGWSLERGQLVLTARKGHKTRLDHEAQGSWLKKDAKPLELKRI